MIYSPLPEIFDTTFVEPEVMDALFPMGWEYYIGQGGHNAIIKGWGGVQYRVHKYGVDLIDYYENYPKYTRITNHAK